MAITATVTRGKTWVNAEEANSTNLNAAALPGVSIADEDVKTAYEANADTNAYTDAEKTKLGNLQVEPAGTIKLWYGLLADVPSGWQNCDGTNGTPDMRGLVPVGAGGDYALGDTGGADSVTLTTAQLPAHSHGVAIQNSTAAAGVSAPALSKPASDTWGGGGVNDEADNTAIISNAGSGEAHENRMPYRALYFIMKL